jgi:hypothetical protein
MKACIGRNSMCAMRDRRRDVRQSREQPGKKILVKLADKALAAAGHAL